MDLHAVVNDIHTFANEQHVCRSTGDDPALMADYVVVECDEEDEPIVPDGYREFLLSLIHI